MPQHGVFYRQTPHDFYSLPYHQHRTYTHELSQTHKALGRLYNKLASLELAIAERKERQLTRKDKKKLQWSRALTKKALHNLEWQQASLQESLRQCNDLIASSTNSAYNSSPMDWTSHVPPTTYPYMPVALPTAPPWLYMGYNYDRSPLYWDLSTLRERCPPSSSGPTADSGFYEPPTYTQHADLGLGDTLNNFVATDSTNIPQADLASSSLPHIRKDSCRSDNDEVPDLPTVTISTTTNAQSASAHSRRYSENAIQLIESRLVAPKSHHRGYSTGQIAHMNRTASDFSVRKSNTALPIRADNSVVSL